MSVQRRRQLEQGNRFTLFSWLLGAIGFIDVELPNVEKGFPFELSIGHLVCHLRGTRVKTLTLCTDTRFFPSRDRVRAAASSAVDPVLVAEEFFFFQDIWVLLRKIYTMTVVESNVNERSVAVEIDK